MKFPTATLLGLLVAEALADLEPLEWLREIPLMLRRQTGQRGGHLRTQGHIATALILKAEQLRGQLATGLFQVESGVLQDRSFILDEAKASGHRAPGLEQVIADRTFSWGEIAESGKSLESRSCHGGAARMHAPTGVSRRIPGPLSQSL
jgi:hypothetical protein